MNRMHKLYSLLLMIVLVASSVLWVKPASAQAIPKPSIPQFTLKFVDASYDVPTTYSTNPYNGATVAHPGYHVQNKTVEISIKNQPFTKYEADGQIIDFYLNIRMKGNYTENWIEIYSPSRGFLTQSESEYTKISYSLDDGFPFWGNFGQSGIIDFQVEALIGSVHRIMNGSSTDILGMFPWIFEGEKSGWSNTQTITIPSGSVSVSPSPDSTSFPPASSWPAAAPSQSGPNSVISPLDLVEIVAFAVLGVMVALLIVVIVFMHRRIKVLELKQNGA